ncbi:MAG: hypothetical protein ABWX59_12950, partial [Microbacteriaceae bacterium]
MAMTDARRAALGVGAALAGLALLSACTADPPPRGPSEEEITTHTQTLLDDTWAALGLPDDLRPDGTLAEDVEPLADGDWSNAIFACIEDIGLGDVGIGWGGGHGYTISGADGETHLTTDQKVQFYECVAANPRDPVASGELLSTAQLAYVYDYYATWTMPCLAAHGITVVGVPSREDFTSDLGLYQWSPYLAIAGDVTGRSAPETTSE